LIISATENLGRVHIYG